MTPDVLERRRQSDTEPAVVVVGDEAAVGLATYLDDDCDVVLVSDDPEVVRQASTRGFDARLADVSDGGRLRGHTAGADAAVVATERDRRNFLVGQLLRTVCGVDSVAVCVNDPDNRELFADLDVDVVDGNSLVVPEVVDALFDADP